MKDHEPIGGGLAFALIAFGATIDLIQFLLVLAVIGVFINWAISCLAILGFGIMLHHHGGGVLKRRGISLSFSSLLEFVPVLNGLPVWTGFAVRTVIAERIQSGKMAPPIEHHRLPRHGKWRI